jgi:hypothetical protein
MCIIGILAFHWLVAVRQIYWKLAFQKDRQYMSYIVTIHLALCCSKAVLPSLRNQANIEHSERFGDGMGRGWRTLRFPASLRKPEALSKAQMMSAALPGDGTRTTTWK